MTVGERIKQVRKERKFTQRYVAQKSGVNVALLQLYEYGKRNPKNEQLKKIADALGVPPEYLRPPKIETEMELLYAFREISKNFGNILFDDDGRGVHVRFDRVRFTSDDGEQVPYSIDTAIVERITDISGTLKPNKRTSAEKYGIVTVEDDGKTVCVKFHGLRVTETP